ncbi:hypothetical protein FRC01_012500, partial [Tulasnella sp. 417]
ANVLISDKPEAVLCDFGLATFVEDPETPSGLTTSRSIKGSLRYMSPELFDNVEARHTLESDIWAWACTIFEVLHCPTFSHPSIDEQNFLIKIITNCMPYANLRSDTSVMVAVVQGASPGSVDLLGDLVSKVDFPSRSKLLALQILIPECWNVDPRNRLAASGILKPLNYLDPGHAKQLPAPPPCDEDHTDDLAMVDESNTQTPIRSRDRPEGGPYRQIKARTHHANGWVSEDGLEPDVVFHFNNLRSGLEMSIAPNGKWLAAHSSDGVRSVWNLENPSTPPFPLSDRYDGTTFWWSPDSRYLAYSGISNPYIWSTESQSSQSYKGSVEGWGLSAAWFSNGEDLVVCSGGKIFLV